MLNKRLLVVFVFINIQFIRADIEGSDQEQQTYNNQIRILKIHHIMILANVGKLNYLTVKTLLNVKGYSDNENFLFELFSLTLPIIGSYFKKGVMLTSVEAWWAGLCALPFDGAQGDSPFLLTN
jgi:hypothetical protein